MYIRYPFVEVFTCHGRSVNIYISPEEQVYGICFYLTACVGFNDIISSDNLHRIMHTCCQVAFCRRFHLPHTHTTLLRIENRAHPLNLIHTHTQKFRKDSPGYATGSQTHTAVSKTHTSTGSCTCVLATSRHRHPRHNTQPQRKAATQHTHTNTHARRLINRIAVYSLIRLLGFLIFVVPYAHARAQLACVRTRARCDAHSTRGAHTYA